MARLAAAAGSLILAAAASAAAVPRDVAPTVQLANGSYYGLHSSTYKQDMFMGVPFAQPPVGDLRLRQPQPLNSTWEGSRNATEYGYQCIGYGSDQWAQTGDNYVSEDCLTLNVVRPEGVVPGTNLPVAVWIHGGGYFMGGGSDPRYNTSFLVQQSVDMGTPIVAVTINYRLSGWGFLFSKELAAEGATNLGLRDQRLALHWIQENIGAFGGDKTKVTIFGESAGGNSVGTHLIAYGGRDDGLFRAAISQSGAPSGLPGDASAQAWQPRYDALLAATGCSGSADSVACLRALPSAQLSAVFNSTLATGWPFRPAVDGDLLQDLGTTQLAEGRFVKVPYLLGCNADEGGSFGRRAINTDDDFLGMVRASAPYMDEATAQTIAALYPDIPQIGVPSTLEGRPTGGLAAQLGKQWKRSAAYVGDYYMHIPRRIAAQAWAREKVPVYSYNFDVRVQGLPAWHGAGHFQEVVFVFNNVQGQGYGNVGANPMAGGPATFPRLANLMSRMWVSFVVNMDPNKAGIDIPAQWPVYSVDTPQNYVFDVNGTDVAHVEKDLWRAEAIDYISKRLGSIYGQ
ncbi:hypothetical protein RB594_004082 [Gaeumannomyces avenae]